MNVGKERLKNGRKASEDDESANLESEKDNSRKDGDSIRVPVFSINSE